MHKFEAELAQFCEILVGCMSCQLFWRSIFLHLYFFVIFYFALQVMDLDRRVRRERERRALEVEPTPPTPLPTNKSEQLFVLEEKLKNLLKQVDALSEAGNVDEAETLERKVLLLPDFFVMHLFHNFADKFSWKSASCQLCLSLCYIFIIFHIMFLFHGLANINSMIDIFC